jgi:formylglycine-generating enzyme required for sulfatase activity
VTQAEWQAVMGTNPSFFVGPSLPVESVSWTDAMAYCAALTQSERAAGRLPVGYQYRLPTEAEWEYCCRAGTTTEWEVGISLSCGQANFWGQTGGCVGQTAHFGSYASNAWGLHDMHGNVWEWCLDAWGGSANYPSGAVSDPYVPSGPLRVLRGGSWIDGAYRCRSAVRGGGSPVDRYYGDGFRVVLAPVLVP